MTHPVVVLSYLGWQRRFGGDPAIVGKDILINNHQFRVIGMSRRSIQRDRAGLRAGLWLPVSMMAWAEPGSSWMDQRSNNNVRHRRLKSGITAPQAEASLNILAQQLAKEYPDSNEGQSVKLGPPGFIIPELRGAVVSFTWVLMAAVALVLLVTCTNLAGLLLARAGSAS